MDVKIFYKTGYDPHINQIVVGYIMLKNLFSSLEIICDDSLNYPNTACVYVFLGSYKIIIYDMHDGYAYDVNLSPQEADAIDVYYKRSVNKHLTIQKFPKNLQKKIKTLPFNYNVTCKENPLNRNDSIISFSKKTSIKNNLLNPLKVVLKGRDSLFNNKIFNSEITINKTPKIMFSTRLWEPENNGGRELSKELSEERVKINKERIYLVKELKREFKDMFIGGIQHSKLSKEMCPELTLPFNTTLRKNYISQMKSADICIATSGLHKSIGWKMGEYVAASKCIVHTPFFYETHTDFQENKNYFSYENNNQLMMVLNTLIEDPKTVYETKINNKLFFEANLKPDRLIYNSIKEFI